MLTRIILAATAAFSILIFSIPAEARRHSEPTGNEVSKFCGDRYCGGPITEATQAVKMARGHRRVAKADRRYPAAPARASARVLSNRTLAGYEQKQSQPVAGSVAARYGMVTVPTAAGIDITVSADFAPKIQSFIADNVAEGKRFKKIHCLNFASSHVKNSLHFSGNACDFSPNPDGALAEAHGLRSGCDFGRKDCMHVDNGNALGVRYMAGRRTGVRIAGR